MLRFIEQNGLEHVLGFLQNMNVNVRQSQLHYTIVGCIKALMNNPVGIQYVRQYINRSTCCVSVTRPLLIDPTDLNTGWKSSRFGTSCWNNSHCTEFENLESQDKNPRLAFYCCD